MVVVGVDPHKHSHTAVAVDHNGRQLGEITVGNTTCRADPVTRLVTALAGADAVGDRGLPPRRRSLRRALTGAGQAVVMVPRC